MTLSRTAIAVACCAALGLALRVAAARDQPWLDEVWSIELARCLEAPSWRRASLVWAIAIGGVLSHLTFAGPLAGALAWAAWRWRRAPRSHVRDALVLFAAPLLAVALLWAVSLRGITTGGGPLRSPAGAMVTAASMALGGPMSGPLAAAAAVGALLVAAWGVLLLARRGADVAVYFAATLVAGPAALVLTTRSLAFPRYLLVQVALVPVLAALVLGVAWNRRGAARLVAVAALAAVLASHLVRDAKLIAIGRGDGASVVRAILDGTPGGGPIVVGGDSDFANRTMLEWHAARAPGGERLHYADAALWPADGPDWLLTITFDEDAVPPREIANASGSRRYALDFIAPHSGLSGWTWSAYRRAR